MSKLIVLPENHPERILKEVDNIRRICRNLDTRNPTNVKDIKNYRLIEEKLFGYATDIVALEAETLGRKDVSTIYSEMKKDTILQLYGEWVQGKKLIYLSEGFYGNNALKSKDGSGRLDPTYDWLQGEMEKYWVDRIMKEPPEEETVGVLKIGGHHIEESKYMGNVPKMLREKGFEVEVVQSPNYQSLIDDCFKEAGLDVDRIRASALI